MQMLSRQNPQIKDVYSIIAMNKVCEKTTLGIHMHVHICKVNTVDLCCALPGIKELLSQIGEGAIMSLLGTSALSLSPGT